MESFDALRYQSKNSSSSRILYDVACKVCQDNSSGKHYGIFACDGCAGFFKRSIRRNRQYICKGKLEGNCVVDKTHRNQCRACRLRKCIREGMNKDAVQHERGPRNSTLQRQMALYYKEPSESGPSVSPSLDLSRLSSTSGNTDEPVDRNHSSIFWSPGRFMAPAPIPIPTFSPATYPEAVCESAASILFMNAKWAKLIPAFTSLPLEDQLILIKESWHELFILSAAQCLPPLDLNPLVKASLDHDGSNTKNLFEETNKLQDVLHKFQQLQIDPQEYTFLKAITLFKTIFEDENGQDKKVQLKEESVIRKCNEECERLLNFHVSSSYPLQPFRLGKIFLNTTGMRTISDSVIEDLFFRRTIGPVPISKIISDMYKSNFL